MTLVNTETGEIVDAEIVEDELSTEDARTLTDRIRVTLTVSHDLIVAAFKGRAWVALGYGSWDAYCSGEFADARMVRLDREQRREIVAEMKSSGMSNRAIASGIGADYKTVMRDAQLVQDVPVVIHGIDGRDRPNRPPANAGARSESASPVASSTPRRRPLPDAARDAGWELRKAVERLERIAADDRFGPNKELVASHLRGHLNNAVEVCQDLLERIDNN